MKLPGIHEVHLVGSYTFVKLRNLYKHKTTLLKVGGCNSSCQEASGTTSGVTHPTLKTVLKFHQETVSSWSTPLLHSSAEMLQHQRKNKGKKKNPNRKKQLSSLSVSEVKEVQNKAQRAKNKLKR